MQNTISPDSQVFFVDDKLTVSTGTVVNIESQQAVVKRSDGVVFTGHVDRLILVPG